MLKKIHFFFHKIKLSIISSFHVLKIVKSETYYPELEHKNYLKQFFENYYWALKFHEPNKFYKLYGLDVKGKYSIFSYKDYYSFMKERDKNNNNIYSVSILRNKFLFYLYLSYFGVPTPKVLSIFKIDTSDDLKRVYNEFQNQFCFLKKIDGECADGVYLIDKNIVNKNISQGLYIVQSGVKQIESLNVLNSSSVNTLCLITIEKNGQIFYFSSGLRVGRKNQMWIIGLLVEFLFLVTKTDIYQNLAFASQIKALKQIVVAKTILSLKIFRFHFLMRH